MAANKQIEQWLTEHGLEQYIDVFRTHDIDLRALSYLSDDDLREIGVSLGHRRILINKISKLHQYNANKVEHDLSRQVTEEGAERRQLTVMFCDLVGSTSLAQQLDPEEMREILRLFQNTVSAATRHYQGYVARFISNGVLSYFGWPKAYEDQAERAIRSSLELVSKVSLLKPQEHKSIQVRIGIDSGLVVVGDLIGEATSDLNSVVGDTPNLAARLQSLALPGEIVIGPNTHRLLGSTFSLRSLGPQHLKGFSDDIHAWVITGEGITESRFEAARGKTLVKLVGRENELGILYKRWQLAKQGQGQIVLLSGEAGIGKSRLASDFKLALRDEPCFKLRFQCSPHHTNSAFFPIIQRLQKVMGYEQNDTVDNKLDKLEKSLKLWGSDKNKVAPLFAELMSVQGEHRYGSLDLTPQQIRQRTIEAMIDQILVLSQRRAVYILLEDAHWIDPSMVDFISELISRIADKPIMLLATYRPENSPDFSVHQNLTSITLDRLSRKHAAEIANSVGGQDLMGAIIERIVERADGVPLYVEELTKSVLESFSTYSKTIDETIIPPTLQSSLVARLDRLEDAKEIAQVGAVIGREFSYDLLAGISTNTESQINIALERLLDSGLVFRRGEPPNETYVFKHSLVQDAAYDTILISRRRRLHALIVEILEAQTNKLANEKMDLIAHHAFLGGIWDKAFVHLQQAGRNAMDRGAVREAVALFENALIAGSHLTENEQSLKKDIDLRFDLRNALWSIGKFERILTILKQAEQLAKKLDDPSRIGWISVFTSASLWQLGRSDEAMAAANRAIEINTRVNNLSLQVGAKFYFGCATVTSGDCQSAIAIFQQICNEMGDDLSHERCGLPFLPAVIARSWMVWALAERGEFKRAQMLGNEALKIANSVGHPFNLAHIYYDLGYFYYIKGEVEQAVSILEKSSEIITEWGLTYLSPFITGFLGYAYALSGDSARSIVILQKALSAYDSIGLGLFRSLVNVYMGKALLLDGQIEPAFAQTQKALELARNRGEAGHQAYALYQLGEITLHSGHLNKELAVNYFNDSLKIADKLGMQPLQVNCYKNLGQYYKTRNELQKAHEFTQKSNDLRSQLGMN